MTATAPEYPAPGYSQPVHTPQAAPTAPAPPRAGTPWYRRAWVLAVAVVLIAVLSFASGFVAGNATAFFNRLGGPGTSIDGPGFPDGVRPGDGRLPQFPGEATSQDDGS